MFKSIHNYVSHNVDNVHLIGFYLIVITTVVVYYWRKHTFWSRLGVKTPRTWPFVGNGLDFFGSKRLKLEIEWPRKYGKIYGYYLGTSPRLAVADAELVRRISIKDFHLFPNRQFTDFINETYQRHFLSIKRDAEWKRLRGIITPTFSSGKMKQMFPLMGKCVDELEQLFDKNVKSSSPVDCKQIYSLYTMDTLARCCFGIKLGRDDHQQSPITRDTYVESAKKMINPPFLRVLISVLIPKFILVWVKYQIVDPKSLNDLANRATLVYKSRKQDPNKQATRDHNDLLQMLIDAKYSEIIHMDENDQVELHHVGQLDQDKHKVQDDYDKIVQLPSKEIGGKKVLTDIEIISNLMLFLVAGHETSANLLSFCTYLLAFHPEAQEKLCSEMQKIKDSRSSFDYESILGAKYMDSVICETLRLMGPAVAFDRIATTDYRIDEYNLTIPKGTVVHLAFYAIHHDPDYWKEPEKFDPTRFLPENRANIVPGSYTPFGQGPRHCVGMRFALTESKLALARLVTRYKFKPCANSVYPPKTGTSFLLAKYLDLNVQVEFRQ